MDALLFHFERFFSILFLSEKFPKGTMMQKKLILLTLFIAVSLSLSACGNTLHGVGQDLTNWGNTIQETF